VWARVIRRVGRSSHRRISAGGTPQPAAPITPTRAAGAADVEQTPPSAGMDQESYWAAFSAADPAAV
jgi:hypothetical protein